MNPEAIDWDLVVVGTGMGGSTLGHALAKAGWRVLFVEKGLDLRLQDGRLQDGRLQDGRLQNALPQNAKAIYDRFAEDTPGYRALSHEKQLEELAHGGRCIEEVRDEGAGNLRFTPYLGCGTGGSSALYGAVLERLFPADFTPRAAHADCGAASLPESWPISYGDLQPWYEAAESLYRVRGAADPLRGGEPAGPLLPPSALSPTNEYLFRHLTAQGVHPYRLHVACERLPECRTCQGYLCGKPCKNDAARICLTPALEEYGAHLLTECTAIFIDAGRTKVQRLICSWRGRRIELRARIFALAAGAMLTPALLLNSKSGLWPDGLANSSGMVGRNLMRHNIDLYVLTKAPSLREGEPTKEVAFNDLYKTGEAKLGSVQSFGLGAPLSYLRNRPGFNLWRMLGPAAQFIWKRHARRPILASILEDLPYAENRVWVNTAAESGGVSPLSMRYQPGASERRRLRVFRSALAPVLKPFGPVRVFGPSDRPALGHICGTCRFGADPRSSVLDQWNRAHGLENLYVVDSSFFPSSGGVNPALTIAANALRVAKCLQEHK